MSMTRLLNIRILFSETACIVFFVFCFLEFIKWVCGLRWMYSRGGVAYYVECTKRTFQEVVREGL